MTPSSVTAARRVLFVRTDRLGETLLNLPAVVALKHALPHASLTLLVHPDLQALMARLPPIDHVIPYPHDASAPWWMRAYRLGRSLRSHRFDIAVISNPVKELHLAMWLARIPIRVGYNRKWGSLLTHRLHARNALGERHEVEYNLDLVLALGLPVSGEVWQAPRVESEQTEVLQLLDAHGINGSQPFIAVHPWSSNPIKQWPVDRYRRLIRQAVQDLAIPTVVIGGAQERERVGAVLPPGVPVANLVGCLTLGQLAALLQRARLLISNDSGPMHLAAAVGTPTIALFGTPDPSTGPRRWGPRGEGHTVIWKPSMEAIRVEEVFEALKERFAHIR